MKARNWLLLAALTLPFGSWAQAEVEQNGGMTGVLLAQKKKPKKKKKKADEDLGATDFGPGDVEAISREDSDTGAGVHREQEGVDRPYLFEATGLTSISMLTTKAGDADPTSSTEIGINGELTFILGRIQIGPALGYNSSSSKENVTTTNPTTNLPETEEVESTSNSLLIGAVFKFNFADLDTSTLVPFAYGGVAYLMGETKQGDAESAKTTGTAFRVGGGANFFLDSNVSFQPRLEYLMQSEKADAEGAKATSISGIKVLLGLGTFL